MIGRPLPESQAVVPADLRHDSTGLEELAGMGLGWRKPPTGLGAGGTGGDVRPGIPRLTVCFFGETTGMLTRPGHQILGIKQKTVQARIILDAQQQHRRASLKAPVTVITGLIDVRIMPAT